ARAAAGRRRPARHERCGRIPGVRRASRSDSVGRGMTRLRAYPSFVRFSHPVFALPFALAGALLASRQVAVTWPTVAWILVAMIGARSAAMGFNRLVDARTDALNPRTANRELPRGVMSMVEATVFVVASSAVFVVACWMLNPLC